MTTRHVLRWVGAEAFVAAPVRPGPALLRFDGDDFMERMLNLLEHAPQRLPELVARPESWSEPAAATPQALPPEVARSHRPARLLRRGAALLGFRRTGRTPASPDNGRGAAANVPPAQPPTPVLKLFQPVHQRYYLAAAHLVCELPGLPPRVSAGGDRSGCVLRRIFRVAGVPVEHAFVKTAGAAGHWQPVAAPGTESPPGEEWLPLFPLAYTPPDGPPRTLQASLIPVARHDEYRFAGRVAAPAGGDGEPESRAAADMQALARMKVIAPWQGLIERAYLSGGAINPLRAGTPWSGEEPPSGTLGDTLKSTNDQLVEASWRLLQEFREFLQAVLPELDDARLASGLAPAQRPALQALLDFLGLATWSAPPAATPPQDQPQFSAAVLARNPYAHASLRAALAAMTPQLSALLDANERSFPGGDAASWPPFVFPLVALLGGHQLEGGQRLPRLTAPFRVWPGFQPLPGEGSQDADNRRLELLFARLAAAIDEAHAAGVLRASAQAPSAARLAGDLAQALADDSGPPRFVLRFVHRRCDCGPLHPLVVSGPSEVFELAGFFDADAPLRPIRIALPFDTTPGGLRKFGKNSAFIMSDVLCGQMKRMRRLGFGDLVLSVLPWPFHKDLDASAGAPCGAGSPGGSFGTICSLSIPIITIVAFVLLIVIATLLDLIFRWLPFLITCFPVPGLKGKR